MGQHVCCPRLNATYETLMKNYSLTLQKNKLGSKENAVGWLFVALPLVGCVLFTLVPAVMSIYLSMTDWNGYTQMGNANFIGGKNYADIFNGVYTPDLTRSLVNTAFLLLAVPIIMLFSLMLALALNRKVFGRGFFRVIYYTPAIANLVVVTILFNKMFSEYGVVNQLLVNIGLSPVKWLDDPTLAKVVIILLLVWRGVGYNTLLYLAGLQNINESVLEAAKLDGVNKFTMFTKIIVPLIAPTTFFILVTNVMGGLQIYTEAAILFPYNSGLGPNGYGTETLMVWIYYQFSGQNQIGSACAMSWVLTSIIFVVTMIQFYVNYRRNKA